MSQAEELAALIRAENYVARVRGMRPSSDAELERWYWEGCQSVPGSVVQAFYGVIKKTPELDDEQIIQAVLKDEARMQLLTQALQWEAVHGKGTR